MQQTKEVFRCSLPATGCSGTDFYQGYKPTETARSIMGHLSDINKSYLAHLIGAWKMSLWFTLGALRLIIHGLIPNIDANAGQNTVNRYFPPKD